MCTFRYIWLARAPRGAYTVRKGDYNRNPKGDPMKDVTLFYLEACPYCLLARKCMRELCAEHPEYAEIPVKMVEEREQRDYANSFDYYYVPCFYVDGKKVSEGAIDKAGVKKVFDKAMK